MSDTPTSSHRSLNIALIISLCVNLLLAGLIAIPLIRFALNGPMFFHRGPPDHFGAGPERMEMHQMLSPRTLLFVAPEKSDKIKQILDSHRGKIDDLRQQSMAARRKVMDIFQAPNFDKPAFEKALASMQAADSAFEREILGIVSETASQLTPEERKKAAEFRRHRRDMMFMRRGEGGFGRGFAGPDQDAMPVPPPPSETSPGEPAPAGEPLPHK